MDTNARTLNRNAGRGREARTGSTRRELSHFQQCGGAGALRHPDVKLQVLRAVLVYDHKVEAAGGRSHGVSRDVQAAGPVKASCARSSLSGEGEEEYAIILGVGFND